MSFLGFTREIDSVGRVVIPKQLRKELGLNKVGTKVTITSDGSSIIINKLDRACIFCKSSDDLIEFNGADVCAKCLSKLQTIE